MTKPYPPGLGRSICTPLTVLAKLLDPQSPPESAMTISVAVTNVVDVAVTEVVTGSGVVVEVTTELTVVYIVVEASINVVVAVATLVIVVVVIIVGVEAEYVIVDFAVLVPATNSTFTTL